MNWWSEKLLSISLQAVLFGLLFYFFPKKKSKIQTDKTLVELSIEFKKFYLVSSLLIFVLITILAILFTYTFNFISGIKFSYIKDALILVKPDLWSWGLAGGVLSFGVSYKISIWLTKLYLKDKFNDYIAYSNIMAGLDTDKIMQFLSPVFIAFSLFLAIITSGSSTVLYNDRIEVDYYFSFSKKVYQYTDVVKIKEIEGESKNRFEITFNDGKVWNSAQNGFSDYYKDLEIVDIIEEKTSDEIWEE